MKYRMRNIILSGLYIINTIHIVAQDLQFSQFYANPLYLCPSFAGTSKMGSRIALNYRDQWPAIPRAFISYSSSFDTYFPKINSGFGLFFLRDVAGSARLYFNQVGFLYSFDFQVSEEWHVRPGTHLYYIKTGLDYSKLVSYQHVAFEEQTGLSFSEVGVVPLEQNDDIDFNTSVLAYNNLNWGGIAVSHFFKPDIYFYGNNYTKTLPLTRSLKYSVFGGKRLQLRGNLIKFYKESLTLAFLYEQQNNFRQFNAGSYYHLNPLVLGVWYRGIPFFKGNPGHDAVVFLLGYQVSDFINLGYSYDFTLSSLKPSSGGAHELSLVWHFHIKRPTKKPQALPCPDL